MVNVIIDMLAKFELIWTFKEGITLSSKLLISIYTGTSWKLYQEGHYYPEQLKWLKEHPCYSSLIRLPSNGRFALNCLFLYDAAGDFKVSNIVTLFFFPDFPTQFLRQFIQGGSRRHCRNEISPILKRTGSHVFV